MEDSNDIDVEEEQYFPKVRDYFGFCMLPRSGTTRN